MTAVIQNRFSSSFFSFLSFFFFFFSPVEVVVRVVEILISTKVKVKSEFYFVLPIKHFTFYARLFSFSRACAGPFCSGYVLRVSLSWRLAVCVCACALGVGVGGSRERACV